MTTSDTTAEGPAFSPEAYAAVEKAGTQRRALYTPIVLEQAAALLTEMWAAGERHGVAPSEWGWVADLAGATIDAVSRPYDGRPATERTLEEIVALHRHLIGALTSTEIGLTARLGLHGASVIVDRGPRTPRGGFHGDADVEARIYSDGGWHLTFAADGSSVISVAAPDSEAGAAQVAEIVRAFVNGELGNPFRG
ncbi:hypothetical protein [Streptomyces sp. NPDC013489]|uniref:hypothetical protein n=1 Tax=Streptomyces sp. NPDC013489 TaxID=3155606 RepID=UPI003409CDF8